MREVEAQVREAAAGGAELVVLPELWYTGYFAFDRYAVDASALDGQLPGRLSRLASSLGIILHAGSLIETVPLAGADSKLTNSSLVFGPDGSMLARYAKVHVFGYGSREPELVEGGRAMATYPFAGIRVGMAICYDLRFPELFRGLADQVSVYVVPATWPAERVGHWSTLLRARAVENQAFVIGCNAAGVNGGVALGGFSVVIDPWGEVVAEADATPRRLDATVDFAVAAQARATFPALRDRVLPAGGNELGESNRSTGHLRVERAAIPGSTV